MLITTKRSGHQSPTLSSTVTERNFTKSNTHARKSIKLGIKACCNRNKYESSSDLKLKHEIFPVRLLFDYRASTYFWKLQKNLVPAFNGLNKISTDKIKFHDRTDSLIFDANATTSFFTELLYEKSSCPVEQRAEVNIKKQILLRDYKNKIETFLQLSNQKRSRTT